MAPMLVRRVLLLVAINAALTSATGISRTHNLYRRDDALPYVVDRGCNDAEKTMIVRYMDETVSMLVRAHERMNDLREWYPEAKSIQEASDATLMQASAYQMWRSLIEPKLPFGDFPGKDQALERMEDVIETLETMINFLKRQPEGHQPKMQIFCSTSWLSLSDGKEMSSDPHHVFFDSRRSVAPDQQRNRTWVVLKGLRIEDLEVYNQASDESRLAIYMFKNMAGPFTSVLAINPYAFWYWDAPSRHYPTFTQLRTKHSSTWLDFGLHVVQLLRWNLPSHLLMELSQMPDVTGRGKERATDDVCYIDTERQTGVLHYSEPVQQFKWSCLTRAPLISSEKALKSADAFALLVIALFLDNRDWSLGYSRPLSAARPNEAIGRV